MNNYVVVYHFDDQDAAQKFEREVKRHFTRFKIEEDGGKRYLGFAAKNEPAVVDALDTILNEMGYGTGSFFGQKDYVALYFTREKDPDNIKRQLLIGTDEMVDAAADKNPTDAQRSSIIDLLRVTYV
ncbi:hypothetical protein H8S95_05775 [Pontibacter sp. KCTC 32443]|uniref:hypothetical protein n=1 Tax=Pontibacter TaxID=323449 RepID=UPI00164DE135|nr:MULTISPECIES: hypothetical protein [Pontibacter]MBC5773565.1 hypothetical protein [Pontibacter sp. KCTC 32443]